jgi:hypothetical protein
MSDTIGLEALSALVRDSSVSGVGRKALLLRTDVLPPTLSRPHQLRLARAALEPLALADRARRHELPGGRLAVSWRGDAPKLLGQALDALDRFLQDDPVEAPGMPELVSVYDLPGDGPELLREAEAGTPPPAAPAFDPLPPRLAPESPPLRRLDSSSLDRLEQSLASADMTRFARRRPVCRRSPQGMQLAWEERSLSIPELIATVAPDRDAKADVWLFRRLTRVLDRRMLSILSDPTELRSAGPFSITLNVASVLSSEFLRFDAALPPALRNRVVISLLPADVASDAGAFAFARNFARARSYRLCLRAVPAALLPVLDLPALELDFVQLIWSAELGQLRQMPDPGGARWIVGRPCDQSAVEWGSKAGIGLFATTPTE